MKSKPDSIQNNFYNQKKLKEKCQRLIKTISHLQFKMKKLEDRCEGHIGKIHPSYQISARNLIHYIAFRRHDVRDIQEQLVGLGLSSLGRSEAAVFSHVDSVVHALRLLGGVGLERQAGGFASTVLPGQGRQLLEHHTMALLGPLPNGREVRIMVTMPREAADDQSLVRELVKNGMNCMRINCAHDGPDEWKRMIRNARQVSMELNRKVLVLMDLAGPKLRTGKIEPGPAVLKWRPVRDEMGRVTKPALIRILPIVKDAKPALTGDADSTLFFCPAFVEEIQQGDVLEFRDARGSSRKIKITVKNREAVSGTCDETSYVIPQTVFNLVRKGKVAGDARPLNVQGTPSFIHVRRGEKLIVTGPEIPGKAAVRDKHGRVVEPARIGCTLPEVLTDAKKGEHIFFDDGKIGGVIRAITEKGLEVEITQARSGSEKLRSEKGINLPDSELKVTALTRKDIQDLRFVAENADLVGLSFVRSAADVLLMIEHMKRLKGEHLGMILKIETRGAFNMLPEILLSGMRHQATGIMIARGDLAVECGYERLAEVQEEILWLSEAAHIPVIWATQVLEGLAKEGLPSRAEITDAAMSERAECVMLNKGPYIVKAVRLLDGILRRMEKHQHKKRAMLRRLKWWKRVQEHIRVD